MTTKKFDVREHMLVPEHTLLTAEEAAEAAFNAHNCEDYRVEDVNQGLSWGALR